MYEIYKINENTYQLHSNVVTVGAVEGSLVGIYKYCIKILGFEKQEVDVALDEMEWSDFDACHFGINRTFIYAFKRNKKVA